MSDTHHGLSRRSMILFLLAPVLMLAWVAFGNLKEDEAATALGYQGVAGARSDEEADALRRLLGEAYGVLRSPQFQRNLRSLSEAYPVVYARPSKQDATVDEIAALVDLEPWGARYAPVQVFLVGGDSPQDFERELASAGEGPGSGRFADMNLGRAILAQYGSGDVVERSCAINAAAHEYAHTISTLPVKFSNAFTDTTTGEVRIRNRRHPGSPVASYLIGAVAQCTWLQTQGRIGAGEIRACVEVFGTNRFNNLRCRAFRGGQPIAPDPRLPPASPAL